MESTAELLRFINVLNNGYRAILIVVRFPNKKGSCTFLRVDSDDNWKKIIDDLKLYQPAEWFRLQHLGIDNNSNIRYFKKYLTILDANKKIPKWIFSEKSCDDREFREMNRSISNPAEEIFEGKDIWEVETGKWHRADHVNATKYKTKRVIF